MEPAAGVIIRAWSPLQSLHTAELVPARLYRSPAVRAWFWLDSSLLLSKSFPVSGRNANRLLDKAVMSWLILEIKRTG